MNNATNNVGQHQLRQSGYIVKGDKRSRMRRINETERFNNNLGKRELVCVSKKGV